MASQPPATAGMTITATADRLWQTVEAILGRALTEAERGSFTTRLAGLSFAPVQPGDLITADLFNALRADVNDLAIRLAALEGAAGGPVIDRILPETGPIRAGGLITIVGRNFASAPRSNRVLFDGVDVPGIRLDSTPAALSLPVPLTLAGLPRSIDIQVETPEGRRSPPRPVRIEPQVRVQDGSFPIQPVSGPTGNVAVNQLLSFAWDVTAQTLFADTLTLAVQLSGLVGASEAAWRDTLAITPASPMPIEAGQTRRVTVAIRVPPGATAADLRLAVTSESGTISNQSDIVEIRVGAPVDVSDPRVAFAFDFGPFVSPSSNVRPGMVTIEGVTSQGIHVRAGRSGSLIVRVTDQRAAGGPAGSYAHAAALSSGTAANWAFSCTPAAGSIAAGDNADIELGIENRAGAVGSTARLRFESRQTSSAGGLAPYTGFLTIPLEIVA